MDREIVANYNANLEGDQSVVQCKHCNRFFSINRINKHEQICANVTNKKRNVFDSSKHRLKGTDAEYFYNRFTYNNSSFDQKNPSKSVGNWRSKHEELVSSLRAAREMKSHLAKGGKLSDLPPPKPSVNPDYVQCPYCLRKFNKDAAARHIPICPTFVHNKPNRRKACF